MQKLFILDAVNFLFRSYYAIKPMTNLRGESTHALFGFIRSIEKVIHDFSPDYVVAVFDGPDNKKSRTAIYQEYKSHRTSMPEDLFPQLEKAVRFCELAGIPNLMLPNVEADDTIGSIIEWAKNHAIHSYICTSDKDLCQLVDTHTSLVHAHKDNLIIDAEKVKELFGISPKQMVDYLALIGDSSDNIPGIAGIGPKTAVSLLTEYGSLDSILSHADLMQGKKGLLIQEGKESALLSKQLATLDLTVPIPQDLSFYHRKAPGTEKLEKFYQEENFISLLAKQEQKPSSTKHLTKYTLIHTEKDLAALASLLKRQSSLCLDTETTSLHPMEARLVGIGLGYKAHEAYYIPLNGNLSKEAVFSFLRTLLETPSLSFYGHNIKYDLHVLSNEKLPLPTIDFDTLLASYLLTPHILQHGLDELTLTHFSHKKISIDSLIGKGKNQLSMQEVPIEQVSEYCCEDIDYTIQLKELFLPQLQKESLMGVLQTIELPLLPTLLQMERAGLFVDLPSLRKLSHDLSLKISSLAKDIYAIAKEEFNINSSKQLSTILYTKLGLPPVKKTQTGFSTSAETLELLQGKSPIIAPILQYRHMEKLRSTYADALQEEINPYTHRIHCSFSQSTTATGRLSCQNPNLQNIPVRSEEGKKIRSAFRPEKEGWMYLSADYSQIELRLLAHFSEDPTLLQAFHLGEDVHAHTASVLFNVPLQEVTPQMRHRAKAVNFGVIYGQQAFGLSQGLNIDYQEAASFIQMYFQRYKRVQEYVESCKEFSKKNGYAITLMGRKRPIPDILSKNPALRSQAERLSVNTPLQGTAADLIKLCMIQLSKDWHWKNSFLLLQIHDELLFETAPEELESIQPFIKKHMETILSLKVPLIVDISVGKNWGAC